MQDLPTDSNGSALVAGRHCRLDQLLLQHEVNAHGQCWVTMLCVLCCGQLHMLNIVNTMHEAHEPRPFEASVQ